MIQPYTFTYIIGYRHSSDRLMNLKRTLDWINGFVGAEIIVIEQDKHSKIENLNLRCKHVFLKSNKPYNKSWAFNHGVRISNSNIIVFADSDLIMHPDQFIEGLKLISQYEMVNPYSSVIDLTQQESGLPFENILKINRPGRGELDHQKVPICGGICIFRKEAINKIGGFDESFIGWGAEDDWVSHKVRTFLTHTELKNKCYHLFHHRGAPDANLYQRNLQLLQSLMSLSKEDLVKYMNKDVIRSGMKNKYSN